MNFSKANRLHWIGWIVVLLAIVESGWFTYDGAHALITGDYVTPESGDYAGQLGPWSKLVEAIGLEPRSTLVFVGHLILGIVGLCTTACFVLRVSWARTGMLLVALLGMWYLPFGTLLSVIQFGLLMLPALRSADN